MLSYQHAYHAGGPADIHKHLILAEILAQLTRKPRGISYAETHAGRGLYDLSGPEAEKTGEARSGIARFEANAGTAFAATLAGTRERHGPSAYPGSPLVAATLLRPQDRITLMELHPAEHAALRRAMRDAPAQIRAQIHRRDGFEGLLALAPLSPRKGLVLVDPSYEIKSDYDATAAFVRRLVAKWPEASVMVWYPLLPAGRHHDLLRGLRPLAILRDEVRFTPAPARGMWGSGVILVNAPFGAADLLRAVQDQAAGIFAAVAG